MVSNYPRSEQLPVMTPAFAKSAWKVRVFLYVWTVVPHALWKLRAILMNHELISGLALAFADDMSLITLSLLCCLNILQVISYCADAGMTKARGRWAAALVFVGNVPILGVVGPLVLLHMQTKDLKKFGLSTRDAIFPRRQLRAIIDAAEKEKVLVGRF
ncbi:MAG TPA: hypothetical protein VK171_11935 [Fimbriimonas sp.]|nr:hypothetical protein [Fimbriimonas sp.]